MGTRIGQIQFQECIDLCALSQTARLNNNRSSKSDPTGAGGATDLAPFITALRASEAG
jgi:hypothetical protein